MSARPCCMSLALAVQQSTSMMRNDETLKGEDLLCVWKLNSLFEVSRHTVISCWLSIHILSAPCCKHKTCGVP
jgi:hypothetical protein